MEERSIFEFPHCLHLFAAALHKERIAPETVVMVLPKNEWWMLQNILERKFEGLEVYDGRGVTRGQFKYMGFRFVRHEIEPLAPDTTAKARARRPGPGNIDWGDR